MYTNCISPWMSTQINTRSHKISHQKKNNEPDFSDKEEWPTEECFEIVEIFKWRDISDGIYRIKNVTHRKGKFGNSAVLTLNQKIVMIFVYGPQNVLLKILYIILIDLLKKWVLKCLMKEMNILFID